MKAKSKKSNPEPLRWSFASVLALAYPLGLMPKAPGTWGSLAGIPLAYGIQQLASSTFPNAPFYAGTVMAGALFAFTLLSWWCIDRTETLWDTHDDGRIVIDEVLGQAIALAYFPFDLWNVGLGFIFFRLFDILKPGPVGWADRQLPGAWGTLLDDVIAGIFAAFALVLVSAIRQHIL